MKRMTLQEFDDLANSRKERLSETRTLDLKETFYSHLTSSEKQKVRRELRNKGLSIKSVSWEDLEAAIDKVVG